MAQFARALGTAGRAVVSTAAVAVGAGAVAFSSGEDHIDPPNYSWSHLGSFSTFDAAAMNRISYRNLVGVCYSEDEAKKLASDITVVDGPNDSGEMFERPGKLADHLPAPYKNEEQARSINNGAYPPDLSLIVKARPRHEDYVFALLTGYREVPAGVTVNESAGQYYNPYFPGGKIGMAKQLVDGAVDYPDGTVATASQMAKDVSVFLAWASEPEHDERKRIGMKWMTAMLLATGLTGYYKRFRWSPIKTRKMTYSN